MAKLSMSFMHSGLALLILALAPMTRAQQCNCIKPDFRCRKTLVYAPAGMPLANFLQTAGCSEPTLGQTADCTTQPNDPNGTPAPGHNGITTVPLCAPGVAAGGTDPALCQTCVSITVIGACEVDGKSYRSTVSCPATPYTTGTGGFVNVNDLGCTSTNPVDGNVGELYFGSLGNTALKRIPYTAFFNTNSCAYVVGANPANGCKSYTLASQGKVIIGNGPLTTKGCPEPSTLIMPW